MTMALVPMSSKGLCYYLVLTIDILYALFFIHFYMVVDNFLFGFVQCQIASLSVIYL